jgi:hypothetical protein
MPALHHVQARPLDQRLTSGFLCTNPVDRRRSGSQFFTDLAKRFALTAHDQIDDRPVIAFIMDCEIHVMRVAGITSLMMILSAPRAITAERSGLFLLLSSKPTEAAYRRKSICVLKASSSGSCVTALFLIPTVLRETPTVQAGAGNCKKRCSGLPPAYLAEAPARQPLLIGAGRIGPVPERERRRG